MTTAKRLTARLLAIALPALLLAAPAQAIVTTGTPTALHGDTDGDAEADRQAVSREIERFRSSSISIGQAMAIAEAPDFLVPVGDILDAFNILFPDRSALAGATGWERSAIDTLDAYVGAWHSLSFPTRRAIEELGSGRFSDCRFIESAGYPLAERCPLVVWTR